MLSSKKTHRKLPSETFNNDTCSIETNPLEKNIRSIETNPLEKDIRSIETNPLEKDIRSVKIKICLHLYDKDFDEYKIYKCEICDEKDLEGAINAFMKKYKYDQQTALRLINLSFRSNVLYEIELHNMKQKDGLTTFTVYRYPK